MRLRGSDGGQRGQQRWKGRSDTVLIGVGEAMLSSVLCRVRRWEERPQRRGTHGESQGTRRE